jgi:hypothetical protein
MTRPIHDYELQNVIEMTQQYIDERVGRLKNIDNLVASKDFESFVKCNLRVLLTMFYYVQILLDCYGC